MHNSTLVVQISLQWPSKMLIMLIPNAAPKTVFLPELWQAHDEPCLALIPNAYDVHPKCLSQAVFLPELWQAHDKPCLALIPNACPKHVHLHWKIQKHMQNVINNWIFNKTIVSKLYHQSYK